MLIIQFIVRFFHKVFFCHERLFKWWRILTITSVTSKFPRDDDEIKWKRRKQERKNTMMREKQINKRWIILGQGNHISKKSFTKIMWFDLWSKLGLHYKQRPFSPSPWAFLEFHQKSGLPWSSTCHGPSTLVQTTC